MKINLMTAGAVAVAGLAVYAFAKSRNAVPAGGTDPGIFSQATAQRQDSGAALAQNTDYLREWASPMSNIIFSNGSLGD